LAQASSAGESEFCSFATMFPIFTMSVVLLAAPALAKPAPDAVPVEGNQVGNCQLTCQNATSSGWASLATGMNTQAIGTLSTAMGYQSMAQGSSSVAIGVNTRTVSDPTVPGGSSCGGCVSMGQGTTTIGDWATAMGQGTTARGYASASMGFNTRARAFGEVALGVNSEIDDPPRSEAELRNMSVIPVWDPEDVVLRVGVGCSTALPAGGFGCKEDKPLDALRVYKSGALFLKRYADGKSMPDVQAAIETCQEDHKKTKQELKELKGTIAALSARMAELERRQSMVL